MWETVIHESWGFLKRFSRLVSYWRADKKKMTKISGVAKPSRIRSGLWIVKQQIFPQYTSRFSVSEFAPEECCNTDNKESGIFLWPRFWLLAFSFSWYEIDISSPRLCHCQLSSRLCNATFSVARNSKRVVEKISSCRTNFWITY